VSVGLVDCYPALLVLLGGLLCSGVVLLLELIDVRIRECRAGGLPPGALGPGKRAAVSRGPTTDGGHGRAHRVILGALKDPTLSRQSAHRWR
jgi:hypothetical protein